MALRDRIVVGIDGSRPADAALAWAVREASLRKAEVVVVYALPFPMQLGYVPIEGGVDISSLEAGGRRVVEDALGRLPFQHRAAVTTRVAIGPPAAVMVAAAEEADLLVLGTRGRGGLQGLLLGSTSYACLHHSPCPVVLLHGPEAPGGGTGPIVVGVDGSDGSVAALTWAVEEARRREATVAAALAWQDPYTLVGPAPPIWVAGEDLRRLENLLQSAVDRARGVPSESAPEPMVQVTQLVRSGRPVDVLLEAAVGAAMLVVGSRGRSPLQGAMLGSVSHRLAQAAQLPVVVVPPPDHKDAPAPSPH